MTLVAGRHRWGHRLFESKEDINIAGRISSLFPHEPLSLNLIFTTKDKTICPVLQHHLKSHQWRIYYENHVAQARGFFNGGLCREFYDKSIRDLAETEPAQMIDPERPMIHYRKYRIIVGCAVIMHCGAAIRPELRQLVNDVLGDIETRQNYSPEVEDRGFREPGRLQFVTAFNDYTPGQPISWEAASCYNCGKMERQLGRDPDACARCHRAWYCDRDCQMSHWQHHKRVCKKSGHPKRTFWL